LQLGVSFAAGYVVTSRRRKLAAATSAPDELTASLLIAVPGAINEPPSVNLFGAMLGADVNAKALLEEFSARVGADPQAIQVAHGSHHDTRRYLTALGDQFEELDRATHNQCLPSASRSSSGAHSQPAPSFDC
jgi:hypothetical protein